jgi:putative transposase
VKEPGGRDLPNETAVLRLIGAVLADTYDEWQVADPSLALECSMGKINTTSDTRIVATIPAGD